MDGAFVFYTELKYLKNHRTNKTLVVHEQEGGRSHPSRKNKNAARVGHPGSWGGKS
jgi:hypothetical protein